MAAVCQYSPRTVYKLVYGHPFRNPSAFEQYYNDGGLSYLAASLATMLLICYYSVKVLQSGNRTFIIAGLLAAIYGFLFIALQLQDYSLLFGTAGLFAVLAIVICVTRNINWYARDQT